MDEIIHTYRFDPQDGRGRINAEVRYDGENVKWYHEGVLDFHMKAQQAYDALNARGYDKLNKYGKIQHDFLTARLGG